MVSPQITHLLYPQDDIQHLSLSKELAITLMLFVRFCLLSNLAEILCHKRTVQVW